MRESLVPRTLLYAGTQRPLLMRTLYYSVCWKCLHLCAYLRNDWRLPYLLKLTLDFLRLGRLFCSDSSLLVESLISLSTKVLDSRWSVFNGRLQLTRPLSITQVQFGGLLCLLVSSWRTSAPRTVKFCTFLWFLCTNMNSPLFGEDPVGFTRAPNIEMPRTHHASTAHTKCNACSRVCFDNWQFTSTGRGLKVKWVFLNVKIKFLGFVDQHVSAFYLCIKMCVEEIKLYGWWRDHGAFGVNINLHCLNGIGRGQLLKTWKRSVSIFFGLFVVFFISRIQEVSKQQSGTFRLVCKSSKWRNQNLWTVFLHCTVPWKQATVAFTRREDLLKWEVCSNYEILVFSWLE